MKAIDTSFYLGMKFGHLTIISKAPPRGRYVMVVCRCDCGKVKEFCRSAVVYGNTKSCGCLPRGGRNFLDLTGRVFGDLTVAFRAANDSGNKTRWHCICSCGVEKDILGGHLRRGSIIDCGHRKKERFRKYATKHGNYFRPGYQSWYDILERCNNPKCPSYKNYGGRGISVCKRWMIFENFIADMGEPPAGMEIDRRNNDGNYNKANCRWVTHKENCRNTRRNILFTYKGKSKTLPEWAEDHGINKSTLYDRVRRRGWSLSRAFTALVQPQRPSQEKL